MSGSLLTIDGSQGEGGGQIVRTSLALAAVTGRPFRIVNLRANRSRPGLMRQHLAAVKAAAKVCEAEVEGAELGSQQITFHPGCVTGGDYFFGVGSSGSTTLILQTVLPALMTADEPSRLRLKGGTHNPLAPPLDFLERSFLPLVRRMGPQVTLQLVRPGFYPAGGGEFHVAIEPASALQGLDLLDRGGLRSRRVVALVSNLPRHIAERECRTIADASGWPASDFHPSEIRTALGPGNVVLIELQFEHVAEVFAGFGRKGVRAEEVAGRVWAEATEYLATDVPVGVHLADQLLLPLSLAAVQGHTSRFRTMAFTQHSWTQRDIIRLFLDVQITVDEAIPGEVLVAISP